MKNTNQNTQVIVAGVDCKHSMTATSAFTWNHTSSGYGTVTRFADNNIVLTPTESFSDISQQSAHASDVPVLITTNIETEFRKLTQKNS